MMKFSYFDKSDVINDLNNITYEKLSLFASEHSKNLKLREEFLYIFVFIYKLYVTWGSNLALVNVIQRKQRKATVDPWGQVKTKTKYNFKYDCVVGPNYVSGCLTRPEWIGFPCTMFDTQISYNFYKNANRYKEIYKYGIHVNFP